MIARLHGKLVESAYTMCVIDACGVGYEAAIPLSTFEKLPHVGEEVTLFIHTQVREDAIALFGFATAEEKALFRQLINVSGIAAKDIRNVHVFADKSRVQVIRYRSQEVVDEVFGQTFNNRRRVLVTNLSDNKDWDAGEDVASGVVDSHRMARDGTEGPGHGLHGGRDSDE